MRDLFKFDDSGFVQIHCDGDDCKKETEYGIVSKYLDGTNSKNDRGMFECQKCNTVVGKNQFQ